MKAIFIFFSKIYIYFFGFKNDNWNVFPVIIISTFITLNFELLFESYFNKIHLIISYILNIVIFTIYFSRYSYHFVDKYKFLFYDKIKIVFFFLVLIFDLVFLFK